MLKAMHIGFGPIFLVTREISQHLRNKQIGIKGYV